MKHYRLFVFTQDNCHPCYRLKDYIKRLPIEQQRELTFYPYRTRTGERTVMAQELGVTTTPSSPLNVAAVPTPSVWPYADLPASVVTAAVAISMKINRISSFAQHRPHSWQDYFSSLLPPISSSGRLRLQTSRRLDTSCVSTQKL